MYLHPNLLIDHMKENNKKWIESLVLSDQMDLYYLLSCIWSNRSLILRKQTLIKFIDPDPDPDLDLDVEPFTDIP